MFTMSNKEVHNKLCYYFNVEQELKALWVRLVDSVNSEVLSKKEDETATA
jgi:hypothetical protein